jgi:NADPH-dependent glutamate synthase beta subunit-like oxidoreductase
MMRYGIPAYRLPPDVLNREIDDIKKVGVNIVTGTRVDSIDSLHKKGYEAIFLAIGAHQGVKMGIPGEDADGVIECVDFLRDVSLGKHVELGSKVGVIGGGNAAIDASRTALRLGAKEVTILYRRTQDEMPASPEEIEEALKEGVQMQSLVAPSRISRLGNEVNVTCLRMQLGKVDEGGRRRPEPIEGSEFDMEFDTVIVAIGQRPEIPDRLGLSTKPGNIIEADPYTLATSVAGVFAGGDVVTGPASVIEAIAAGRQGAISIDKYLGGQGVIDESLAPEVESPQWEMEEGDRYRPQMSFLGMAERLNGFPEVELGFTREQAIEEARRCLRCDLESQD